MDIKKIFIISLILMLLFVPTSFAANGDFKIPSAIKDVTVNDDGSVFISEQITYVIEGSVNGTYREIPIERNQTIRNISVDTPGYYNDLQILNGYTRKTIKVWLYSDKEKTKKVEDATVKVTYNYTIDKGVRIYNDVADVQYMTWGSEWKSGVDRLESNIHIPGSYKNTQYWNNPEDHVVSSNWTNDNTLTTKLENIPQKTLFEQRILMPTSYFKSTRHAQVINQDAKALIEADQKKYQNERNQRNLVSNIIYGIYSLLLAIPLAIYGLFGREPKIDYDAEYEYDLPDDSTPMQVNLIVVGNVGQLDKNSISTKILDLIERKYYTIVKNDDYDTVIKESEKDTSQLKTYERTLMKYLSNYAVDGEISFNYLSKKYDPIGVNKLEGVLKEQIKEEVPNSLIEKYFDNKGARLFNLISKLWVIIAILLFIIAIVGLTRVMDVPSGLATVIIVGTVALIMEAIAVYVIPNTSAGRWTPEGKKYHDRWKNFEKYLKDFSLINEQPPKSVAVWGKYLVYAAALGCADEATKNMKQYFSAREMSDVLETSDVTEFAYHGGLHHMETSFVSLSSSDSDSSGGSDSIGSSGGGGFGGGGGGTF